MNEREHDAHLTILNHIRSNYDARTTSNFAQVFTKGKVLVLDPKLCTLGNQDLFDLPEDELVELFQSQVWSYMVLRRYGDTLEKFLFKRNEPFTLPCALKIGLRLLE